MARRSGDCEFIIGTVDTKSSRRSISRETPSARPRLWSGRDRAGADEDHHGRRRDDDVQRPDTTTLGGVITTTLIIESCTTGGPALSGSRPSVTSTG
jgi:hypothetical protein